MVNNYKAPVASIVYFEATNVITTSAGTDVGPTDTPDVLSTWGRGISEYFSSDFNLFG